MKMVKAEMIESGSGACIEIGMEDGSFIRVSNTDGTGLPEEGDWCVARFDQSLSPKEEFLSGGSPLRSVKEIK